MNLEDELPPLPPEPYAVEVIRSDKRLKTISARVVEGRIRVRIPAWMSPEQEHQYVAGIVARVEKKLCCSHIDLQQRARRLAHAFDLPEPDSIDWSTKQRFRWGSCTIGNAHIRISSRLAEVPPWVLDHVIVHELAHLVEAYHSAAFYELVARNPLAERAEGYLLAFSQMASPSQPGPVEARRAG